MLTNEQHPVVFHCHGRFGHSEIDIILQNIPARRWSKVVTEERRVSMTDIHERFSTLMFLYPESKTLHAGSNRYLSPIAHVSDSGIQTGESGLILSGRYHQHDRRLSDCVHRSSDSSAALAIDWSLDRSGLVHRLSPEIAEQIEVEPRQIYWTLLSLTRIHLPIMISRDSVS
jgi:hypothetical protein